MDRLSKNRIAMSFVDLHDRVMHNPKMAMDDQRIQNMSKRQQAFYMEKRRA